MNRPADQERIYLEAVLATYSSLPGTPSRPSRQDRRSLATSVAAACPSGPSATPCSWPQLAEPSAQARHCRRSGPSTTSFPQSRKSSNSRPTPDTSNTSPPSSSPSPVRKARFLASANRREWSSRGRPQRGVRSRRKATRPKRSPRRVTPTRSGGKVSRERLRRRASKPSRRTFDGSGRTSRQARPTRPTRWSVTSGWLIGSASSRKKGAASRPWKERSPRLASCWTSRSVSRRWRSKTS